MYDAEGSPIGMQYRNNNMPEGEFYTYWYEKNLQGDIVAIYSDSGVKIFSYSYDAWGNVTTTRHHLNGSNRYAVNNPFRYRGYYYDIETGFYYLQSRYYDPNTGRFINADGQLNGGLLGYNQFSYCENNPVTRYDADGEFWDTVFDVVSLGFSIADVIENPTDPWAWAGLVGDAIDLVPFVTGVGEATRAINTGRKVLDAADNVHDALKAADNIGDTINGTIDTYKALKKADSSVGKEVHHIVEKRFGKRLGFKNTGEMLSIALDQKTHREITNAWRKQIKYGTDYSKLSKVRIWDAAQEVYKNYPELLEAARKTIFR